MHNNFKGNLPPRDHNTPQPLNKTKQILRIGFESSHFYSSHLTRAREKPRRDRIMDVEKETRKREDWKRKIE